MALRSKLPASVAPVALAGLSALMLTAALGALGCGNTVIVNPSCDTPCKQGFEVQVEACPAGSTCVSRADCDGNEVLCVEPPPTCTAFPSCHTPDQQVETCPLGVTCYASSLCGATITCAVGTECPQFPACDPDDSPAPDHVCPLGASCYTVSACGAYATCIDTGNPHGCPLTQPTEFSQCDHAMSCGYPAPNGFCWSQLDCVIQGETFAWKVISMACE